jgi:hypothetical protein
MKHPFHTLYYTGMSVLVFSVIFFVSLILNLKNLLPSNKTEKNYVQGEVIEGDNTVSVLSTTTSINLQKEIIPVKNSTKPNVVLPKISTVHDTAHETEHDTTHTKSKLTVIDTNSSKTP